MHLRAQWAALRMFHRPVKRAGYTVAGQPIFVFGSVQLFYPRGGRHFFPLIHCSRCGDAIEFPSAILAIADLAFFRQRHLCPTCARGSALVLPRQGGLPSSPSVPSPAATVLPAQAAPDDGGWHGDLDHAEEDVAAAVNSMSRAAEIEAEIKAEAHQAATDLVAVSPQETSELQTVQASDDQETNRAREQA